MKKRKWRIALSVVNLLLALGMSALGTREWGNDRRLHPEYFYHGNLYYMPPAQWMSYSLNAPSFVSINLAGDFAMRHHLLPSSWFGIYCFYFVHYEYFAALFLFWWWVGRSIDMSFVSSDHRSAWVSGVEIIFGFALGGTLILSGVMGLQTWYLVHTLAIFVIAWGVILLLYSLNRIWQIRLGISR